MLSTDRLGPPGWDWLELTGAGGALVKIILIINYDTIHWKTRHVTQGLLNTMESEPLVPVHANGETNVQIINQTEVVRIRL